MINFFLGISIILLSNILFKLRKDRRFEKYIWESGLPTLLRKKAD